MKDWYFAGMFDEAFWAVVGKHKLKGLTAAEVLRPLVAAAALTPVEALRYER